jgi:hypothetical protein
MNNKSEGKLAGTFEHVQCNGSPVYVSLCLRCHIAVAWSPSPELLDIADIAHRHRITLAEDTPEPLDSWFTAA